MAFLVLRTVTLVLALAAPVVAQVAEIRPSQVYQAGARVGASSLGVSFVIPEEWVGTLPQESDFFAMQSNTRTGLILVSGDEITSMQEAIGLLSEPLDIDGTNVLQPVAAPVVEDGELTQSYRLVVGGQELTGEAHAFVSPHGIGLVYVAIGPVAQADYYRGLATDLAASTELTTPVAEPAGSGGSDGTWDSMVRGYKLHYITSSSGYNNEEQIDLCTDGTFAKSSEGGAVGGLVSGAWQDGGSGRWSISNGQLLLTYPGGQVQSYDFSLDDSKLLLNGYRYFRVATDRCG